MVLHRRRFSARGRFVHNSIDVVGTAENALIREVNSIQSVLYREVPQLSKCNL